MNETYVCKYCGKICKNPNSLRNHERLCKLNPNRQTVRSNLIEFNKKRSLGLVKSWNFGLTKHTSKSLESASNKIKALYASGKSTFFKGKHHTKSTKTLIGKKCGGAKKMSGKGHKGWYKGIWCHSSWELAFVIYNLDRGIDVKRYDGSFEYEYNGRIHKYFPDFLMPNGTIIEIKGYSDEKAEIKHKMMVESGLPYERYEY